MNKIKKYLFLILSIFLIILISIILQNFIKAKNSTSKVDEVNNIRQSNTKNLNSSETIVKDILYYLEIDGKNLKNVSLSKVNIGNISVGKSITRDKKPK